MKIASRLNKISRRLKLDPIKLSHVEVDSGFTHFNIECWSTWKYSFRHSDNRYVRELANLNGVGISERELCHRVLREALSYKKFKNAHEEAVNKADGNYGRVIIVDREDAIMLVVSEETAMANFRTHYYQVWVGDGERPFTWEAFSASEAVKLTQAYYHAKNINNVTAILKVDWEREYREQNNRGAP